MGAGDRQDAARRDALRRDAEALSEGAVGLIATLFDLELKARPKERIDGRPCEPEGLSTHAVVEKACDILAQSCRLLSDVEQAFSRAEPSGARELCDLAFMGRAALRDHRLRLEDAPQSAQHWQALMQVSAALREAMKCLTALEHKLAELGGFFSRNRYAEVRLEQSLAVRRAYARFHKRVRAARERPFAEISAAVVEAGLALDELCHAPVYEHIRIGDRLQIGAFKGQILGWLSEHMWGVGGAEATVESDGARLLSDLSAFAALLRQINLRAELVSYDATQLARAVLCLPDAGPNAAPEELLTITAPLYGLDDELDGLLDARTLEGTSWRACLLRLSASRRV